MARSSKSKTAGTGGNRSKPTPKTVDEAVEDAEVVETKPDESDDAGAVTPEEAASGAADGAKDESTEAAAETEAGAKSPDAETEPGEGTADLTPAGGDGEATESEQADAQTAAGDAAGPGPDETLAGEPAILKDAEAEDAAGGERPEETPTEATADTAEPQAPWARTDMAGPDPEPTVATPQIPLPPPQPPRRSAMPVFFGGVIAALLGAGALYVSSERGWIDLAGGRIGDLQATVDAQSGRIDALQAALDGVSGDIETLQNAQPDLSPVTAAIDGVQASVEGVAGDVAAVSERVDGLAERLDATDARLADVETQPIPEAELPAEVVEAYERRLAEMQGAIDTQFGEMQAAQDEKLAGIESDLNSKLAEIESARGAAADAEAAAAAAAQAAETRAALAELNVALDTGGEFTAALSALTEATGGSAPAVLADNAEAGIATLQDLKDGFPAAAREALAVSIQPDPEAGASGRLGAFFRRQLGVRSLEPREGDDPDAVLSRAEAALEENDIAGARDLIARLPEAGQAAFADWTAAAGTRLQALDAVQDISDQINGN